MLHEYTNIDYIYHIFKIGKANRLHFYPDKPVLSMINMYMYV